MKLFQKKAETKAQEIDVREAFTLWDVLNSKYMTMERVLILEPYVTDIDLKVIVKVFKRDIAKNIDILHTHMKTYNIISPNKNRVSVPSAIKPEILSDEFIALELLLYEQEHVENLLLSFYSMVTNDNVRGMIHDMLYRTIDATDKLMSHLSLRGWVGTPPAYRHLPTNTKESIHCGEAGCLWDLLTYRYDTLHFTEIMSTMVHDVDLLVIIQKGIGILKSQVKEIEKELTHFGINMPKRPADVTITLNNKDFQQDSHIYRMIFMGMQGAGSIHVQGFKKFSSNNRLRKWVKKLLHQEVERIDDLILFGKVKGWLQAAPLYGP